VVREKLGFWSSEWLVPSALEWSRTTGEQKLPVPRRLPERFGREVLQRQHWAGTEPLQGCARWLGMREVVEVNVT